MSKRLFYITFKLKIYMKLNNPAIMISEGFFTNTLKIPEKCQEHVSIICNFGIVLMFNENLRTLIINCYKIFSFGARLPNKGFLCFYSTPSTEGVESTRGNSVCVSVCLWICPSSLFPSPNIQ